VRLEGLAAPGSTCVSGTVRDHVGDRLPYAFEDMGEQSVKNIAQPVRPICCARKAQLARRRQAGRPPLQCPSLRRVCRSSFCLHDLSDDREQQYFADGITEDLTTDLSRLENMFVISRNTAFTYETGQSTRGRSAATSACAMCSKGASGDRATSSASALS